MKNFRVTAEQVRVLSYAVSDYINGLGNHDLIEGVFVMPCGEDKVDSIVLGVVYNSWEMGRCIKNSNKGRLYTLAGGSGIELQVKDVSLDKCLDYFAYREYDQPIKGMIKTGAIIYDASGKLHKLQAEYQSDMTIRTLESRGAVAMEPVIQYSKRMRTY